MDSPGEDKQWAYKYLLDPLTAPEPSQETGPGSHFNSVNNRSMASSTSKGKSLSVNAYPTPPTSASPTRSSFHPTNPYSPSHRQTTSSGSSNTRPPPRSKSLDEPVEKGKARRRESSLGERYPGDMSHRPLTVLRKEVKAADRSPHLKKRHRPGADIIDQLDSTMFGGAYHHEGPYDATLFSRNTNSKTSPVEATKLTNAEALRATPREYIRDALERHVPLQGTAIIPPGVPGFDGRPMQYTEGADLMRERDAAGGAYKRWDDVEYLPEDYKGKGEPSFSIERALKGGKHDDYRRVMSGGSSAYEMQPPKNRPASNRLRSSSGNGAELGFGNGSGSGNDMRFSRFEDGMHRSNSTGKRVSDSLKKRFGSLRRSKKTPTES